MQLKDATTIIRAILEERDKIPLMINTERYIPYWRPNHHGEAMRGGIRKALRVIEKAPVVDAAPVVHARWGNDTDDGYTPCTNCGWKHPILDHNLNAVADAYCPHCGAKMDGGDEE